MATRIVVASFILFAFICCGLVPAVDAQSYSPSGKRRGTYVSIYSNTVGAFQLAPHGLKNILGDTSKENTLLDFLKGWKFNAISLYNLHVVLQDTTLTTKLRSFITRARQNGIFNVEAIGGEVLSDYTRIDNYQRNLAQNDDERFDGVVTEAEYWAWNSQMTLGQYVNLLNGARNLNTPGRGTNSFYYCSYLGFNNQGDYTQLVTVMDYMWPHSYVPWQGMGPSPLTPKASELYGRTDDRIAWMRDAVAANNAIPTNSIKVTPIFSAEGTAYKADPAPYPAYTAWSGDMVSNKSGVKWFETTYESSWAAATTFNLPKPSSVLVSGYQWYEYVFVYLYLKDVVPPTSPPAQETPQRRSHHDHMAAAGDDDKNTNNNNNGAGGGSHHGCGTSCHIGIVAGTVGPVLLIAAVVGVVIMKRSELKKCYSEEYDVVGSKSNLDDRNPDDKTLTTLAFSAPPTSADVDDEAEQIPTTTSSGEPRPTPADEGQELEEQAVPLTASAAV